jgi:AcrR family transcriptional regulator
MLDALTDAVAERGFNALTVTAVVSGAGVSRKTFYEHWRDRDECFLAAYEDGLAALRAEMLSATTAAVAAGEDIVEQLRASVRTYLTFLADRPALARTFVLEVLAAGPAALERRAAAYAEFADVTRQWHQQARATDASARVVPDAVYAAVVGAGHSLVAEHVRLGRTSELPELEPLIMYIHLALLADQQAAEAELPAT